MPTPEHRRYRLSPSSDPEIYNNGGANPGIDHSVVRGSGGSASWDTALGNDNGGNTDADPLRHRYGGTTAARRNLRQWLRGCVLGML